MRTYRQILGEAQGRKLMYVRYEGDPHENELPEPGDICMTAGDDHLEQTPTVIEDTEDRIVLQTEDYGRIEILREMPK